MSGGTDVGALRAVSRLSVSDNELEWETKMQGRTPIA